jgi:hypothetical protein
LENKWHDMTWYDVIWQTGSQIVELLWLTAFRIKCKSKCRCKYKYKYCIILTSLIISFLSSDNNEDDDWTVCLLLIWLVIC